MRNRVKSQDLETVVNSAMKDSASVSSVAADGESNVDTGPAFIPPHNRDATQPEDVYILDDIITPAEMVALCSGLNAGFLESPGFLFLKIPGPGKSRKITLVLARPGS